MENNSNSILRFLWILFLFLALVSISVFSQFQTSIKINVIPTPLDTIIKKVKYIINSNTTINAESNALTAAEYLIERIKKSAGIALSINKGVPNYFWPNFMVDSGRQYQNKEFIKKYIDYLKMLNVMCFTGI